MLLGRALPPRPRPGLRPRIYHEALDAIATRGLKANVSVKLSQMGMDFDPALAEKIVGEMVEHASRVHSFVRIDMEGSPYTEATIAMTEHLNARCPGCVGTVLRGLPVPHCR